MHVAGLRSARITIFVAPLFTLALTACDGDLAPEQEEPAEIAAAATVTNPFLDFVDRPSYLPAKSIVLTFDDGPDDTNTGKVLDILKTNNLKVTFFINTINYTDVNTDPTAQALVKRIVNEGHALGNHTVHHPDLATLSDTDVEAEISGVEKTVANVLGARRLTLFRSPYGSPFDPNGDTSQLSRVAPIVGKHAVHVGWNVAPEDFNCADSTCVFNNVKSALQSGQYGIILLHSPLAQTVGALQNIIDYGKSNGYTFRSVEDAVVGKYGTTSDQLIGGGTTTISRVASADTYVRDGSSAGTNFGTVTILGVKKSATAGNNRIGYLKFSISSLPSVSKAVLRVAGKLNTAGTVGFSAGPVSSTGWSETTMTWNNRPAIGAALATSSIASTSLTSKDLDVTAYVQGQRSAGKTVVSFALQGTAASDPFISFNAREASASKPTLIITP
jgi:peptidoglycan/xylan/chitin deacetylase (PgdA/CDA1 family)